MKALITGVTGQDGSYLAEHLLELGYEVHGLVRRNSSTVRLRLDHLTGDAELYNQRFFLHYADLEDTTTLRRLLMRIEPLEVYHLAGQSHVGASFEIPESTCDFTAMGTLRLLEILRDMRPVPRLLHASSSEIFGRPDSSPQNEQTPMRPVNPYGVAKTFATQMVRVYRDAYELFGCNAICYNHESPRRGESFVTRKITKAAAQIKLGLQKTLSLGDIQAQRDWGYAPDYVRGMHLMLQQDSPGDYVLATGQLHSVADFLQAAFDAVGLDYRDHLRIDPRFMRPVESSQLCGDPAKAQRVLGWHPSTTFADLAALMVRSDLERLPIA